MNFFVLVLVFPAAREISPWTTPPWPVLGLYSQKWRRAEGTEFDLQLSG